MLNSSMQSLRHVLYLILIFIITSCQKELKVEDKNTIETNIRFPQTAEEKSQVDKIKIVKSILEKIYSDPKVVKEVNAAIMSGYYKGETVGLKDLLNPNSSSLYTSEKFRRMNVETGIFEIKFKEGFNKRFGGNNGSRTTSDYFQQNGITIYYPYSENYSPGKPADEITLVAADRDADTGPGDEPIKGSGSDGTIDYVSVTVNDDYADRNATHIVGVTDRILPITRPDSLPPPSGTVDRVFHGYSRLANNYDKFISFTGNGGSSEIKIARISGYLQIVNQQVTNFAGDVVSVEYTRSDVKKKRWHRVYSVWDPDWVAANNEQIYSVWEEDNQGTKTFTGSLSTTVTLAAGPPASTGTGSIGFSVSVVTQDELITQRKISRYAYFTTAKQDQGAGFNMCSNSCGGGLANPCQDNTFLMTGYWPIWDCGTNWKYLWPYKIY